MRTFNAGELVFLPVSNEFKDWAVYVCVIGEHIINCGQSSCSALWVCALMLMMSLLRSDAVFEDSYWTTGRSVLLENSSKLHPDRKWLAVDGRVRATPVEGRGFGLFWAMTRTQDSCPRASSIDAFS